MSKILWICLFKEKKSIHFIEKKTQFYFTELFSQKHLLSNVFSGDKNVDFGGTLVSHLLGTTTYDGDNNQMLSIGVQ